MTKMAAPYEHEHVRIRVSFTSDSPNFDAIKLTKRWMLIFFAECRTIGDVEFKIISNLNRQLEHGGRKKSNDEQTKLTKSRSPPTTDGSEIHSIPKETDDALTETEESTSRSRSKLSSHCEIWLNGFWLPSFESSRILKDDDEVTVKTCYYRQDDGSKRKIISAEEEPSSCKRRKKTCELENVTCTDTGSVTKTSPNQDGTNCYAEHKHTSGQHEGDSSEYSRKSKNKSRERDQVSSNHMSPSTAGLNVSTRQNDFDAEISTVDKDSADEKKSSKKKQKKRKHKKERLEEEPLQSFEANTNVSKVREREGVEPDQILCEASANSEPACPWSEEGRQYLQSLIKNRIGELTSQSSNLKPETSVREEKYKHSQNLEKKAGASVLSSGHISVDTTLVGPERIGDDQTSPSKAVVAKRRRRHRKKKNPNKEIKSQSVNGVESNAHVQRDYSLRLPQHLQPRQDNRVLFDDDDEDDLEKIDDLGNPTKGGVDGHASNFLPAPSCDNLVSKTHGSNHHKLTVSLNTGLQNGLEDATDAFDQWSIGKSGKRNSQQQAGVCLMQSSDDNSELHNSPIKMISAKPRGNNFVSADDKFASLLGSTKRLPGSVQISPSVVPRLGTHSAEGRGSRSINDGCIINTHILKAREPEVNKPADFSNPAKQVQTSLKAGDTISIDKAQASIPPTTASVTQDSVVKPSTYPTSVTQDSVTKPPTHPTSVRTVTQGSITKPSNVPTRHDIEEGLVAWPKVAWPRCTSMDSLPVLTELPSPGDILVYKVLELTEDYTPSLSDYKKALVLEVNTHTKPPQLELLMCEAEKKRQGRFELEDDGESEDGNPDIPDKSRYLASVSWLDMVEARLVSET